MFTYFEFFIIGAKSSHIKSCAKIIDRIHIETLVIFNSIFKLSITVFIYLLKESR